VSSQASAVSRSIAAAAAAFSASALPALRKYASARQWRLSARVSSCVTPMRRIVMKSWFRLNRSGPPTGRLSTPADRTGSARRPAATAMSRAAAAEASIATSWRERCVAMRWASASVNADGAAAVVPAASKAR
jgi:hypothetical protein